MKKPERITFLVISVLLVIVSAFLFYEMIALKAIPTKYMVLGILVVVLIDGILILLMNVFFKKRTARIICAILSVVMMITCGFGGYYIHATGSMLSKISNVSTSSDAVSVIVKESSALKDMNDLEGSKLGTLRVISRHRTALCLEEIDSKNITYEQIKYESLTDMLEGLYDDQVDAIVLPEGSRSAILDLDTDKYANFDEETRVLYQTIIKNTDDVEADSVEDITSHSFNVLITGSDSRIGINDVARSDVNMIVTVNPQTHTILLTSIPRDYYVRTVCDAEDGCQNGAYDKLTHTGINGINTTKMTIEELLGIEINYTFKVGFQSVTEIVDALGGIDIDVTEEAAVQTQGLSIGAGKQHVDGKTALRFARERYAYVDGDRQRTRNQQIVLMGIIDAVTSPSVLMNYTDLLNALSDTFKTTMTSDEIASLVQFQLDKNPEWKIEQYMVDGAGNSLICAELGTTAYVMVPDQTTVKTAKEKINTVFKGTSSQAE